MPSAMLTAHRTSGTVPAQFHFDVTRDPTIAAMLKSGIALWEDHFEWNFGDGSAETFSTSGLSSNTATGPVATHVYRAEGSYTATLTFVRCAGAGVTPTVYKFTQSITVAAFSGTTYYLASTGNDSNTGLFGQPFLTWATARAALFASNGPRRLLLNKGDTFECATGLTPTTTGLFIIGAYGSGAAPIIDNNNTAGAVNSGIVTPPADTAFELIVEGISVVSDANVSLRTGHNTLYIDCTTSLGTHALMNPGQASRNYCTLWNCTIGSPSDYGVYFNFGAYCAIIGCTFNTITGGSGVGEHMIRCYLTHSSVCHNSFIGTMLAGKHALKFVGYFPTGHGSRDGGEATEMVEYCSITDNNFAATLACNWQAVLGPIDAELTSDQRHQYVLYERNWHDVGTATSQVALFIGCNYNCVRNNIIDGTGAGAPGTCTGVRVSIRGGEPAPTDNVVANNTGWRSDAAAMRTVQVVAASVGIRCYNNAAQSSTGADALSDAGTGTVNSGDVQGTSLGFTDGAGGNFLPAGGSSLIAAGTVVAYVYRDYLVKIRNRTTNDTGAHSTTTMAEPAETSLTTSRPSAGRLAVLAARGRRGR